MVGISGQRVDPQAVMVSANTSWNIVNFRADLLDRLVEAGFRPIIVAPPDRYSPILVERGFEFHPLPMDRSGMNPFTDALLLLRYLELLRRTRAAIYISYTIKPNIYGSIAAKLAGVQSVAVTTGLGYVFIQHSRAAQVAKRLYRFAFRFPREVWFLNRDDQAAFVEQKLLAHPERARLLHGEGVDLEQFAFTPLPERPDFRFVLIGRLLWDKGVGEYVQAARRLRERYPRARFQLLGPVGVDNPSAITREEVAAWEQEGVIEYLGEAHDVRPLIADADCIVLPSYREGVPRTLMEASAMGRPIVTTDVPGCREVVADGVNGLLCEVRNADSLATQLARMLDMSHAERRAMAERGRQKVAQEFDERVVVETYKDLVQKMTGVLL